MQTVAWAGLGFLLGAMPLSLWLGYLLLRTDIRHHGDGNPGATNAWRAGGWQVGVPALLLDYLKAAVPVGLAYLSYGLSGWCLVPVALAPVLGHAYSPFLHFRGGKAVATTFGLWTGLTLAEGPLVLGLAFSLLILIQDNDGWAVVLGLVTFLGYLLLRQADVFILVIWAANSLLLAWKYRADLSSEIRLRPWVLYLLRQTGD